MEFQIPRAFTHRAGALARVRIEHEVGWAGRPLRTGAGAGGRVLDLLPRAVDSAEALALGAEVLPGGATGDTNAVARGLTGRAERLTPRLPALNQPDHAPEGATGRDPDQRPTGDVSGEVSCPIVEPGIVHPGSLSAEDVIAVCSTHGTTGRVARRVGVGEPEEGPWRSVEADRQHRMLTLYHANPYSNSTSLK